MTHETTTKRHGRRVIVAQLSLLVALMAFGVAPAGAAEGEDDVVRRDSDQMDERCSDGEWEIAVEGGGETWTCNTDDGAISTCTADPLTMPGEGDMWLCIDWLPAPQGPTWTGQVGELAPPPVGKSLTFSSPGVNLAPTTPSRTMSSTSGSPFAIQR